MDNQTTVIIADNSEDFVRLSGRCVGKNVFCSRDIVYVSVFVLNKSKNFEICIDFFDNTMYNVIVNCIC